MNSFFAKFKIFTSNSDLAVAFGAFLILCVMVIPIHPVVLDLFLSLVLSFSLIVLLVSIYSRKPLDFSTFPTVLLLTTLFRLSLNVASTRNILLRGTSDGTSAAGQIIRSFGEFVVEGNYVVGIIVFIIFNGPSLYVERIDIKGNNQTLDKVIRREFSISEGDAFNPTLIRKSEEKLRALGFFKNLSVSVLPGSSSDKAVVTVDVEEAPTGSLNFGAGYSTDTELSGTISLSERNFLGKGQRLLFEVLTSESNKSIKFGFTEPALLNRDLSASIDLTYLDLEPRQSSFTSNESSIRTGFGFKLGNDTRLITSLKILEEKISVPISSNSLILREDQGRISKSELSLDYFIDGRDSIIKPKNGFLLRSDITISGLGSRNSFIKGSARGKIYNSFFDNLITVTGELEGGFMQMQKGFSRTVDRFSLGGRSLRGFQYGQIGPREGDEPLGGENYAVSRIEANFPIGLPKELGFYGGIFAEAGSLWGLNYDNKKIEVDANNLKSVDSKIRSSVGFTLYWSTPIGPLQFNWAKPQQYLSGVDKTENFSFNIASQF